MASFDKIPVKSLVNYRVHKDQIKPFFSQLRDRKLIETLDSGDSVLKVTNSVIKEKPQQATSSKRQKQTKTQKKKKTTKTKSIEKSVTDKVKKKKKVEKKLKSAKVN